MTNEIVRAITGDGLVKAAAITGRGIVERARNIHKLLPTATAALGRTLLGASLLGDMLKEEKGALTLQIKGGGPLGTILAVSDCEGNVRGYVQNPQVELMEQRCEPQLPDGSWQALSLRSQDGLYGRDRLYYHTGSGYGVYNLLTYDPESRDAVVVLTTGASGAKDSQGIYAVCAEITEYLYDVMQSYKAS